MSIKENQRVSRRSFLKASAAGMALPYFVRSRAFGANERIVVGCIGVGGMGRSHVPGDNHPVARCAALCDVDQKHLADVAKQFKETTPQLVKDFREILDRKDIDAVTIGTPDHWHAVMTVWACQAGKDVYSEKPMCRTIQEGQAMINAARYYKRAVQIGAQGRSNLNAHAAATFVRNGNLGRVKWVEFWHENNWFRKPEEFPPDRNPPPDLDWDMWLGPARWRPYNPAITHFHFRWMMDFGGGFVRDRGQHGLSIVFWCMGMDGVTPESITVEAKGEPAKESMWDVPVTLDVKWEIKGANNSIGGNEWTLTWQQPGGQYPFPHDPEKRPIIWGAKYHGDRDELIVAGGDGGCDTEPKAKRYQPASNGVYLEKMISPITDATQRHRENWYDCIKTRGQPICNPEVMFKVITLPIIANVSYQLGRKLTYDPKAMEFVGDDEANRFLAQPYRAPWRL